MPDLALGVVVSRDALGLADLDCNDRTTYRAAVQFLGGQVVWNRQKVGSPFVDGETTTQRSRGNVTEQVAFEVLSDTDAGLQAAMAALIAAFNQDSFTLTATIGAATYAYRCEAADVQTVWTGVRFMAKRGQVIFSVPRQPIPITGGV